MTTAGEPTYTHRLHIVDGVIRLCSNDATKYANMVFEAGSYSHMILYSTGALSILYLKGGVYTIPGIEPSRIAVKALSGQQIVTFSYSDKLIFVPVANIESVVVVLESDVTGKYKLQHECYRRGGRPETFRAPDSGSFVCLFLKYDGPPMPGGQTYCNYQYLYGSPQFCRDVEESLLFAVRKGNVPDRGFVLDFSPLAGEQSTTK